MYFCYKMPHDGMTLHSHRHLLSGIKKETAGGNERPTAETVQEVRAPQGTQAGWKWVPQHPLLFLCWPIQLWTSLTHGKRVYKSEGGRESNVFLMMY